MLGADPLEVFDPPTVLEAEWIQRRRERVQASALALASCPRHEFERVGLALVRCRVCGTQLSVSEHGWYLRGIAEGRRRG